MSSLFFVHKCCPKLWCHPLRHHICSISLSYAEAERERVWKKDKERKEDRQQQRLKSSQKKSKTVCTLLCSWSISTTSDPRLESASCSNLSGALWGDSMCCGRETERWRNYIEKCLTHFGPGLGFWTARLWSCRAEKKEDEQREGRRRGKKESIKQKTHLIKLNIFELCHSKPKC